MDLAVSCSTRSISPADGRYAGMTTARRLFIGGSFRLAGRGERICVTPQQALDGGEIHLLRRSVADATFSATRGPELGAELVEHFPLHDVQGNVLFLTI